MNRCYCGLVFYHCYRVAQSTFFYFALSLVALVVVKLFRKKVTNIAMTDSVAGVSSAVPANLASDFFYVFSFLLHPYTHAQNFYIFLFVWLLQMVIFTHELNFRTEEAKLYCSYNG